MGRATKAELELENAEYRAKLEEVYDSIGEALGLDANSVDDEDEEEDDETD